tara:strand:- start:1348 stop:2343 length:996 start_codon:yes stop_codon:yes gene_type:complete
MKNRNLKLFFFNFVFFNICFFFSIFILNYLIDPLWYFSGNKISKTNYVYNERLSKFNNFYYNKDQNKVDCLIFGSSISTTINEKKFKKNNCYNFSFSAGSIKEYRIFLDYLNFLGFEPKKIYLELPIYIPKENYHIYKNLILSYPKINIVGFIPPIVTENLLKQIIQNEDKKILDNDKINVPDFVKKKESPKKFWNDYFSFNSFVFSIKSIFKISNYTNAYDENFIGFVRKDKSQFGKIFKKKKLNQSDLDLIIKNRKELLTIFTEVYDFSVPNEQINNNKNTYDGSHYYEKFISLVADSMEGSKLNYGLKINHFDYHQNYLKSINEYYNK